MTPIVRKARESDMGYVKASWCRDAYELTRDRPSLYTLFRPLFESVQARILKSASVLVVTDHEDHDLLFGCCVYETSEAPVLHYVAIKRAFRQQGLATSMLKQAGFASGQPAIYSLRAVPQKMVPRSWTFVPYGLMP